MLRRPVLALFLAVAATAVCIAPSVASDDDPVIGGDCEGVGQYVTVCREQPGSPGGTNPGGDPGTHSGKDEKPKPQICAVERLDPQPPASDPVWKGHKPGDGAIYTRVCIGDALGAAAGAQVVPQVFWAAEDPAVNVDPEQLAREAVDRMLLTGPDIASPRPAGRYVVGMPMWMWVNQSPTTYGPNSASATLADVTVTATAKVSRIDWAMGDGEHVTCHGPGTKYTTSYGKQASPTCGHTYSRTSAGQKGGKYPVAATAIWAVDWQVNGGGETGQFTETRQSQAQVAIGEVQVVR
ncbi:ATP/GTP-binding protein [Streptomyces sp. NBC_00638]|uniref:ATP/GTP-binding protein n=1 Tax=Streptomyces sp. NBC_00638 TaxID=2975794 RepID=UPI002253B267|nr:ATP/GTP-binding protein [Streptomyces sp. NBC_00638]MCX5009186.1 ATP/GTP-binding protein [Streptomyces sp. NBC_00638]